MISPRLVRRFALLGGLVAAGILLGGCSALQNVTGHLNGRTATPKLGDCWTVTYSDAQSSEDWQGPPAVPCTQKHESYTFAITKLTQKFSGSWMDSKGNARADVDTAAYTACLAEQKRLLPGVTAKEALLYPTYYVPSVSQWNSGARWVRCDLTEIRVGSTFENPQLTTLPARFADLVAKLKSSPETFALCEDDPSNNGPDGAHTMYARCTGPSDWTLVFTKTLPGATDAPFPGSPALKALGDSECVTIYSKHDHVATAVYPTKQTWTKYGDRALDCWLNNN